MVSIVSATTLHVSAEHRAVLPCVQPHVRFTSAAWRSAQCPPLHDAHLATPRRFYDNIGLHEASASYDRGECAMATMIDGESYVGRVLIRPVSQPVI